VASANLTRPGEESVNNASTASAPLPAVGYRRVASECSALPNNCTAVREGGREGGRERGREGGRREEAERQRGREAERQRGREGEVLRLIYACARQIDRG
jgi:hypothetical protein